MHWGSEGCAARCGAAGIAGAATSAGIADAAGAVGVADAASIAAEGGKVYLCIDLKSFYASAECVARGLDPLTTRLVVADPARGEKTICLAVTPAMKALGVSSRCRVFEIPQGVDYIMARPRMRHYMHLSADIYRIYLSYVSARDIHVYSIDECFIDATPYLALYGMTPRELAVELMEAVLSETGISATAGVGTNLFLAKVALDVTAKHAPDNIGFLDEAAFRRTIWDHRPITDIWNIGPGIARRLEKYAVFDLRGVTLMREETLYREFGANAEYLIDHAWGQEPCTIAEIQAYEPEASSMVNGQVLPCDYSFAEARMVMREMVDASVLELVEKGLVAQHISLHVGYGSPCLGENAAEGFRGSVGGDFGSGFNGGFGDTDGAFDGSCDAGVAGDGCRGGGRRRRRGGTAHGGGSRKLGERTNSFKRLIGCFERLFDETVAQDRPVRRINVGFGDLLPEEFATFNLFTDMRAEQRERDVQEAVIAVRKKFGKNAMLKGVNFLEKATARERNEQVGGHHA